MDISSSLIKAYCCSTDTCHSIQELSLRCCARSLKNFSWESQGEVWIQKTLKNLEICSQGQITKTYRRTDLTTSNDSVSIDSYESLQWLQCEASEHSWRLPTGIAARKCPGWESLSATSKNVVYKSYMTKRQLLVMDLSCEYGFSIRLLHLVHGHLQENPGVNIHPKQMSMNDQINKLHLFLSLLIFFWFEPHGIFPKPLSTISHQTNGFKTPMASHEFQPSCWEQRALCIVFFPLSAFGRRHTRLCTLKDI